MSENTLIKARLVCPEDVVSCSKTFREVRVTSVTPSHPTRTVWEIRGESAHGGLVVCFMLPDDLVTLHGDGAREKAMTRTLDERSWKNRRRRMIGRLMQLVFK